MSEELQKLSENVHDGYFLVSQSVSLGKWRWEYYYKGIRITGKAPFASEEECMASISTMRTCAEAAVYLDA